MEPLEEKRLSQTEPSFYPSLWLKITWCFDDLNCFFQKGDFSCGGLFLI